MNESVREQRQFNHDSQARSEKRDEVIAEHGKVLALLQERLQSGTCLVNSKEGCPVVSTVNGRVVDHEERIRDHAKDIILLKSIADSVSKICERMEPILGVQVTNLEVIKSRVTLGGIIAGTTAIASAFWVINTIMKLSQSVSSIAATVHSLTPK